MMICFSGRPDRVPVAARELGGRVDGVGAAAGGEEDRRAVHRRELGDLVGELHQRRIGKRAERVEGRELLELRADRVGDLVAAIADVHVPERGGGIEVGLALVVPHRRAAALRDHDLTACGRRHVREPSPQLRHVVSSFLAGAPSLTAACATASGTAALGAELDEERVRHAGGGVGGLLVERLGLEQRLRERVQLRALARAAGRVASACASSASRRTSASTSFCVSSEVWATPGSNGPSPSAGSTATGPMAALMPQRPDHLPRDRGHLLDVGLRARADAVVDQLLGDASAQRHAQAGLEIRLVVVEAIRVGGRERHAERHAARDDRDLAHGVGVRAEHADQRVPRLVVGGALAVVLRHHHAPLDAQHDLLDGVGEVGHLDRLVAAARGQQRGLVDEVREVGADHSRRGRGDRAEIDVGREREPSACAP